MITMSLSDPASKGASGEAISAYIHKFYRYFNIEMLIMSDSPEQSKNEKEERSQLDPSTLCDLLSVKLNDDWP